MKKELPGRITPRMVRLAYKKTGLRPCTGAYLCEKGACAIAACVLHKGGTDDLPYRRQAVEIFGVSVGYVEDFEFGYDGISILLHGRPYESEGWLDGRDARKAIFGEVES
jgi:hypothetical protein